MKLRATQLGKRELAYLRRRGWQHHVGDNVGIWVRASCQQLVLIRCGQVLCSCACSTAEAGLGNRCGSLRTPVGWHKIAQKIGHGLPIGAVLKRRVWTGEVWRPGSRLEGDLILSRILRLSGMEAGRNRGWQVDTYKRMIYIHGTNAQRLLGRPVSQGCVRLSNRHVIALFELVDRGCRVLITAE